MVARNTESMKKDKAKSRGYTHLVKFFGYRCWFNENTNEIEGVNWLNDKMIDLCTFFFIFVYSVINQSPFEQYWKIEIIEEL